MNHKIIQIAVGSVLAFFLLVIADLVPFWMPMMGQLTALVIVSLLLLWWVGFVMQETVHDERELQLKMKSSRIAYVSGLVILMVALLVQGINHMIDPWIAVALAAMILSKLLTRIFLE